VASGRPREPHTTVGVAIPVPMPHGAYLEDKRAEFGDPLARTIPAHITLLAPARVHDHALPHLEDHLRAAVADIAPFDIYLRGTASFRPVEPVVFVPVVQGIRGCEALEKAVRSGPLLRRRRYPYHPHVTVAQGLSDDLLDFAFDALDGYSARWRCGHISLYRRSSDGVWSVLSDIALGGNEGGGSGRIAPRGRAVDRDW